MALIRVPRPENAWNSNRPVNALLQSQILHLHDAELKLPVRQQTQIYINAIKTEGEAADYVRQVTEAIHAAHQAAAAKRGRLADTRRKKGKTKKNATPKSRRKT
jgi:uncharacterized protein YdbL (DUF1318 family)